MRLVETSRSRDAVDTAEWQNICAMMEAEFGRGDFEAGVLKGIAAVSRQLAAHFPKRDGGDGNELPDAPVVM